MSGYCEDYTRESDKTELTYTEEKSPFILQL